MHEVLRAPVTEAQLEWARHVATHAGLSVAEWLRSLVDRAIGEHRCAECAPSPPACKSCATRKRRGFEGLCSACAQERTQNELTAERALAPTAGRKWPQ